MDTILQLVQQRKTLAALIGGCVLGLLLGLVVGWVLWPVEYTNATPSHLRSDFRSDYVARTSKWPLPWPKKEAVSPATFTTV